MRIYLGCRWVAFFIRGVFFECKKRISENTEIRFFCCAVRIEKFSLPFVSASPPVKIIPEDLHMTHKKTLNKTIDYIKEHIYEKLSTKIIAEYAGYSVYYFGRMFKEYTGKTIMAYVRDMRLELAKDDFDENRVCDLAEKFGDRKSVV